MNFLDIIKDAVLQIIQSLNFTDIYIGEVIEEEKIKIKLDEKFIIGEDEIVRTSKFYNTVIKKGTKLVLLKQGGGQYFFLIDTILEKEEGGQNVTY